MLKLIIFLAAILAVRADGLNVFIADAEPSVPETTHEANDLCSQLNCIAGQECIYVENQPKCVCVEHCDEQSDVRLKVCSSSNQTYESECHFSREKCWCTVGDNKCRSSTVMSDTLDYFGACQYIAQCTDEQKQAFPSRIKVWLDEVLNILSERQDLKEDKYKHLVELANQMKKDKVEKYWTCGVAFEFCELDKSHDGIIEVEEMRALIAPIKALENCIQPFLQECDQNKDDKISDTEWAQCLDLSEDDLKLLRTVCKP